MRFDLAKGRAWWLLPLGLAVLLRVLNLGGFSSWLDEILQTIQTRGSFGEAWAALREDPDQPPLDGLVTWLVLRAGGGEVCQRLTHIVWGVLTVGVLAAWARRRWSPRAGLAAGLLAAASPFHVRYSQEIRPYALSLLLVVTALYLLDGLLEEPAGRRTGRRWLGLGLASAGVVWTHHLAALFLAATSAAWVAARWAAGRLAGAPAPGPSPGLGWGPGLAAGIAAVAALPLLPEQVGLLDRAAAASNQDWTLDDLGRRWQALTVAGVEGAPASAAALPCLLLALLGSGVALGRGVGRRWLVGAVLGTFGVELALSASGHWSNARYDLWGWAFVVLLAAAGIDALAALAARKVRRPAAGGIAAAVALAAPLAAGVPGLQRYYESGRPRWDQVAELATELAAPEAPLLASNEWTRISLAYYLEGGRREVRSIDGDPAGLEAGSSEVGCTILTVAGYPQFPALEPHLRRHAVVATFPAAEARLYAVPGSGECPARVQFRFRRPRRPRSLWGLVTRPWHPAPDDRALEFDAATAVNLEHGWSAFERAPDGTTFAWAAAVESSLALELASAPAARLELRVWPVPLPGIAQTLEPIVNGRSLGARLLAQERQTLTFGLPPGVLRPGENGIRFRYHHALPPGGGADPRPLAVAFDRLAIEP